MVLKCSTCGMHTVAKRNFVKFACPSCGEETIVRCSNCKQASNRYKCLKCEFTGP